MTITSLRFDRHFLLDGEFIPAGSRSVSAVFEKATGDLLSEVPNTTAADVDTAADAARRAQPAWARQPVTVRIDVLRKAAVLLAERRNLFVDWLIREAGSTRSKAAGEVSLSIDEFEHAAFLALQAGGETLPSGVPGRVNLVERVPVGTVALITAFNFPLQIAVRIMAPALALGNAVLLKPAPSTPVAGGQLIAELMLDAGVPAGVLAVLPGDESGPALVTHPRVDMVHFTGSAPVGRVIAVEAARTLKKVALELGGNSASVVLGDADLDLASRAASVASFTHQGQVCIATSRHIVVRSAAEEYTKLMCASARALSVGDPAVTDVDLGPMISTRQVEHVQALVHGSVSQGARLMQGGDHHELFYPATVVTDIAPGMPLFDEEIFGPVAPITVVHDAEEALRLVNTVEHALSAAVFTNDLDLGWSFAEQMRAGMVHVNDATALHEVHIPFGGVGASGVGERLGGRANIDLLTERRWLSLQRRTI